MGKTEQEPQPPSAASLSWLAAAAARGWAASIRAHAAWRARSAACSADAEANEAARLAVEDGRRVVDENGQINAAAMGRVVESLRLAAGEVRRSAGENGRAALLFEEAAFERVRAYRAFRRAGSAEPVAAAARRTAAALQESARDAARQEARELEGSMLLLGHADRMARAGMLAAAGKRSWGGDPGALSRSHAAMWEAARRMRQRSAALADIVENAERRAAKVRGLAARAAGAAAEAAGAAAKSGGGGGDDPEAAAAAAERARAAVAARRADAEYPEAGGSRTD